MGDKLLTVVIIIEKDCDGVNISAVGKKSKLNSKDPSIILFNDGKFYHPIYRATGSDNKGLFDSRMKFIRKMVKESI